MEKDNTRPENKSRETAGRNNAPGFLKYSGLATQMLGTILIFTYGGYKLDEWQQNKVPLWTLVLSLASIGASLYMLIKSFSKK
jgi:hypothetical protein